MVRADLEISVHDAVGVTVGDRLKNLLDAVTANKNRKLVGNVSKLN